MSRPTIGIEEEFMLLDAQELCTVDLAARAVAHLGSNAANVQHEFQGAQLEFATGVHDGPEQALAELTRFRSRLRAWADDHGVIAAGTGTPYRIGESAALHPARRYARIAEDIGALAGDHQIDGLHVHVHIADRDAGVAASNALRPWLPILLALSANSPFWRGTDTGYASWRALHSRRWTTHGIPPVFADAADYDRTLCALRGLGATSDPGTINWNVRLSATHPTVEVRVCDAQLSADRAVALAVLIRALVAGGADGSAGAAPAEPATGVWDASMWHAARHGLSATLLDPSSATIGPARHAVRALMTAAGAALDAHGDRERVEDFVAEALRTGTGATHQWRSHRHGPAALADLYRRELIRGGAVIAAA